MKTFATVAAKKISVIHEVCADVDREFLRISIPNGWDDVKKLVNKVLTYDGRDFTYSGWNSERNVAYFYRRLAVNSNSNVATIR